MVWADVADSAVDLAAQVVSVDPADLEDLADSVDPAASVDLVVDSAAQVVLEDLAISEDPADLVDPVVDSAAAVDLEDPAVLEDLEDSVGQVEILPTTMWTTKITHKMQNGHNYAELYRVSQKPRRCLNAFKFFCN